MPTHITDRGADFISTISQQVSVERLFLRKPVESEFRMEDKFLEEGAQRCPVVSWDLCHTNAAYYVIKLIPFQKMSRSP